MRNLLVKHRFIGLIALVLVGGMWPAGVQAAAIPSLGSVALATKAATHTSLVSTSVATKAATSPSLASVAVATMAATKPSTTSVAVAIKAAAKPSLGSAAGFAALAGTAASCTTSAVTGNVGVNFNPPTTAGCNAQFAPGAYSAFRGAFTGTKPACDTTVGSTFPAATTNLGPGAYCTGAALTFTDQTLNLTGTGSWFFEIGAGFTATNLSVVMVNGGNPCNVFWWIGADATLTVNKPVSAPFQGTILGGGAITLTGSAANPTSLTLTGHVWATTALTMTNSTIVGCNAGGTVGCGSGEGDNENENEDEDAGQSGEHAGNNVDEDAGQSSKTADKEGDCDRSDSDKGDNKDSNHESGSTAGNPGHEDAGETSKVVAEDNKTQESSSKHTSTVAAKESSTKHATTAVMKQSSSKHKSTPAAKEGGHNHSDGNNNE